jgi:hypothetical protein
MRSLLAALLGGCSARRVSASSGGGGAAPRELLRGFRREKAFERRYRADAAIIFCGITVFTKRGVGGAYAAVETGGFGEETALGLQFAAGSDPAQCAGLNRFGILQEAVIESAAAPQFAFAGLITDSKEEDLESAKKALHASARQQVKLARGSAVNGRVRAWTETLGSTQISTWRESAELLAELAAEPPRTTALEIAAGHEPFLAAMRRVALCREPVSHQQFLHAGKLYSLELRRRASGERAGLIRNQRGAKAAEFRVWYSAGDETGLPLRIEYHAKAYLRLIFEADDQVAAPAVGPIFSKEAA